MRAEKSSSSSSALSRTAWRSLVVPTFRAASMSRSSRSLMKSGSRLVGAHVGGDGEFYRGRLADGGVRERWHAERLLHEHEHWARDRGRCRPGARYAAIPLERPRLRAPVKRSGSRASPGSPLRRAPLTQGFPHRVELRARTSDRLVRCRSAVLQKKYRFAAALQGLESRCRPHRPRRADRVTPQRPSTLRRTRLQLGRRDRVGDPRRR